MLDSNPEDAPKQERPVLEVVPDRSFEKKLRWLMQSPPEVPFVRFVVTPAMADTVLRFMPDDDSPWRQRPHSVATSQKYANQMKAGFWRETRAPLIFTQSKLLGDGQHRMNAVITAGVAVPFWFAFGDDDENFFVYDNNKVRGPSDIFAIKKVPFYTMAAAASKWIAAYDAQSLQLGGANNLLRGVGTPEQAYRFYLAHEGVQESMHIGTLVASNKMQFPSLFVALHYLAAKKNRAVADAFFARLATGLGFDGKTDPAYRLREFLTKSERRLTQTEVAVLIVDAWNAFRSRKAHKPALRDTKNYFPRMI